MIGLESIGEFPGKQVIFTDSAAATALIAAALPEAIVITTDLDATPEDYAPCADRDVVCFTEFAPILQRLHGPKKLQWCSVPVPADFSLSWAKANTIKYPPANAALRHVQPLESDAPATRGHGPSPGPRASGELSPPEPVASDPSQDADTGPPDADLDEPLPDVPDWATEAPAGDAGDPEPINGQSHLWVAGQTDYWPDPIDIFGNSSAPDEFDLNVFKGDLAWIGQYCADISELKGTDRGIAAMAAIISLSAWCHESWRLQVKSRDATWKEAARLWGLVIGDSSDGKSPGMNLAAAVACALDDMARKEGAAALTKYASEKRQHDIRLAEYEKKQAKGEPNAGMPEDVPHIEIDARRFRDANIEGFRSLLEYTRRGWLYTDELSAFVASMGKYSSAKDAATGERSAWIQAWDGGQHTILRAAKPIHVDSWSLCILGGVTTSSLRETLGTGKLQTDGFIQRFLMVQTRHQIADSDHEQDPDALAAMTRTLANLRHMRPLDDLPLRLSPEAYAYFQRFMIELDETLRGGMYSSGCQSSILKFRSHAPRLALTLHLAMRAEANQQCAAGEFVSLETMETACNICRELIPHTIYFWDVTIGERNNELRQDIKMIAEAICCWYLDQETIVLSEIGNSFKKWQDYEPRQKAAVLAYFQEIHWLKPAPDAKQYSPGVLSTYRLHPALFRKFDRHPDILAARPRRKGVTAKFAKDRAEREGRQ